VSKAPKIKDKKMAQTVFIEAINQAIAEEMRRDESVFIMGEDIRRAVYGATADLLGEFGEKRVLDTPLSENGFFGAAIGASLVGMRPIVETLTSFMWVGMDQLISQAAKMRYMFGGQATLPVVYRATMFYGGGSAAHHSDRSYPMFMNMPGIKIVVPSNPADMKGLLKAAVRDDDPTIVFEDGTLFGMRGDVPDDADLPQGELVVPFGEAKIVREGTDCTIVGIGGAVNHAATVADQLAQDGISVEVIDPRTLVPFDKQTVLDSVEKTGRLVIADPAHKVCSAASEIASIVAEEGFWSLQAPIQKVASEQVHIPYSPALEKHVYPDVPKIAAAVKRTLES
jgi:pyruvate dehydrogenase E1 component beta subunit